MRSMCPQCEGVLELEYYIKAIRNLKVAQITFNVKCLSCGAIVPLMITPAPNKDLDKKKKAETKKRDANYIG